MEKNTQATARQTSTKAIATENIPVIGSKRARHPLQRLVEIEGLQSEE